MFISIYFEINFEKSLGKASSFTYIYGILIDFPDLTLYLKKKKFGAYYESNTLRMGMTIVGSPLLWNHFCSRTVNVHG